MRHSRRGFSAISLSFLDIMSCGFGAVVLLFLIIKHHVDVQEMMPEYDLNQEIGLLEQDIGDARQKLASAKSRESIVDADLLSTQANAEQIRSALAAARAAVKVSIKGVGNREIEQLKIELKRLDKQKMTVQAEINAKSGQVRTFIGEGNREYLTGLNLGGRRNLILLDVSASMLDDTIVNIIRRRNMDDAAKRRSWKWRQALATVDWISARFPAGSQYQIFTFNTAVEPVLANTKWKWLQVDDLDQINHAIDQLKRVIPAGGSSLAKALASINRLSPKPDNIFLLTDGLPTQGLAPPRGNTVTGRQRRNLFEDAMTQLPRGIPINTILLPMEGDPLAAWAYWQIAVTTGGAFLTPARDWP